MANNRPKNKQEIKKLFKSYRVNKDLRPAAAYEPVQKQKSPPVDLGDLITLGWTDIRGLIAFTLSSNGVISFY